MQVGAKVLQKGLSTLRGEEPREVARDRIYRGWLIEVSVLCGGGKSGGNLTLLTKITKRLHSLTTVRPYVYWSER